MFDQQALNANFAGGILAETCEMPKQVGIQTWKSLEGLNKWSFYKYGRMSQHIQSGNASLQLKGGWARLVLLWDTPPLPKLHPLFCNVFVRQRKRFPL